MNKSKITFVAEIGGNHGGSFETAKEMIYAAKYCGADYVKFQKRDVNSIPINIASRERYDAHAFGNTEYEHRLALEFSPGQHESLKRYAESCGIRWSCSAWDTQSVRDVLSLKPDYLKIPSAKNIEFMSWGLDKLTPIHVALGMTTEEERNKILEYIEFGSSIHVPYSCISKYPTEHKEACLGEIEHLVSSSNGHTVGYSGHHKGIALDLEAVFLGASIIERHFTLDRSSKGTDHAASLEPEGLRKLIRDVRACQEAYKFKPAGLPACEIEPRRKLKGD